MLIKSYEIRKIMVRRKEVAKSLFGILPKEADIEAAKAERLGEKQMRLLKSLMMSMLKLCTNLP